MNQHTIKIINFLRSLNQHTNKPSGGIRQYSNKPAGVINRHPNKLSEGINQHTNKSPNDLRYYKNDMVFQHSAFNSASN